MKQIITYILIFALTIQFFWGSGLLVDYYVNSDVYKENCQNKDRPELKCNGKCILAQKLLQSSKEDEAASFWSPISFEYLVAIFVIESKIDFYTYDHQFRWSNLYQDLLDKDIFKPPV